MKILHFLGKILTTEGKQIQTTQEVPETDHAFCLSNEELLPHLGPQE